MVVTLGFEGSRTLETTGQSMFRIKPGPWGCGSFQSGPPMSLEGLGVCDLRLRFRSQPHDSKVWSSPRESFGDGRLHPLPKRSGDERAPQHGEPLRGAPQNVGLLNLVTVRLHSVCVCAESNTALDVHAGK